VLFDVKSFSPFDHVPKEVYAFFGIFMAIMGIIYRELF